MTRHTKSDLTPGQHRDDILASKCCHTYFAQFCLAPQWFSQLPHYHQGYAVLPENGEYKMSQSDIADAPCLKFYLFYNPNMLRVLQFSMHICPSALVVAAWHGNYSSRKMCKMAPLPSLLICYKKCLLISITLVGSIYFLQHFVPCIYLAIL